MSIAMLNLGLGEDFFEHEMGKWQARLVYEIDVEEMKYAGWKLSWRKDGTWQKKGTIIGKGRKRIN